MRNNIRRAADWMICAEEGDGWFAWNGHTRKRIDLYPIPEGGTWRDSLHHRTKGIGRKNAFSVAVEQFERLIGPYYPSAPEADHADD